MDLEQLRKQINDIDDDMAKLFVKRMEISRKVSEYKMHNGLPIFQRDRENAVLDRVSAQCPDELKNSSQVLFQTIMDISKCRQYSEFFADKNQITYKPLDMSQPCSVAVPGTRGSFSQSACEKLLPNGTISFFDQFESVFSSVDKGDAQFGVVPIANSTAGSVTATYELLKKYDLKICCSTKLRISHCLAATKGTSISDISIVYSHEQALAQCSEFIKKNNLKPHNYANTALAAEYVRESSQPFGAICSKECAVLNGLEILAEDIANAKDNFTRFIVIAKETLCSENADIVSVSLSLPHEKSALYRLLTKFSVAGLNLLMIESRPLANTDFEAVFYLDFQGSINDPNVAKLINELETELEYFKFLGSYEDITD